MSSAVTFCTCDVESEKEMKSKKKVMRMVIVPRLLLPGDTGCGAAGGAADEK
jgi:hypothetical protein